MEGCKGRGGEGGGEGSYALDGGYELTPLLVVDGVVPLEQLPHIRHSAQRLRDLGHHDPLRHPAAKDGVQDEGD
jgi:hypothetical protein